MRNFAIIIILLVGGCSSGYDSTVECYSTSQFRKFSTPSFSSYFMNVKSGEMSRADIYIQMPYRNIRFERASNGFKASYQLTFVIRDEKKEIVQTKEVDRPITARTYEESVSSRYDFHLQPILLKPNEYSIEIIAKDNLSQLRYRYTEQFTAKDFSDSGSLASSVLFLNTMLVNEKGISIRPVMPNLLSMLNDSVGMFQELYNVRMNDTIHISEEYRSLRVQGNSDRTFSYLMPPCRVSSEACVNNYDSVSFKKDSVIVSDRNGTIRIFQFYPLPSVGANRIVRTVAVKRNGKTDSVVFVNDVFLRGKLYRSSLSYDEITSAMRYIMREQEYDSLFSAAHEDLNAGINAYWELRGGIERRIEFERKIAEANALFTTCEDGSRTAMGIVYIVCGAPDYIDCRGAFIESWYYNVGDRAFPVEFRRESKHLQAFFLTPFSVNDYFWQYFVDRWRRKK
jgi:GWxTD domain-containing protein